MATDRPTVAKPIWAALTTTLPTAQIPNKIQPTLVLRQQGFDRGDLPQAQEENFWRNSVYQWIDYLDDVIQGGLDADTLDGIDSTGYWQRTDIVDAGLLNGQPASTYLGGDADTLGGELPSFYLGGDADTLGGQPPSFYLNSSGGDADTLGGRPPSDYLNNNGGDADTLNGQPGSFYLGGDADTLGGLPPSAYLGAGTGPIDADTLDGLDSTAFALIAQFQNLPSANGYQRFPNGLIIQWGRANNIAATPAGIEVVFPLAFPNSAINVQATEALNNPFLRSNKILSVGNFSNTSFRIFGELPSGTNPPSMSPTWIAIGG